MNKQGLYGAIEQYWTVEPKARLHRRNSFFDDHQPSSYQSLKIMMAVSTVATAIVVFWSILGVLL
jgi:hypothetical protein